MIAYRSIDGAENTLGVTNRVRTWIARREGPWADMGDLVVCEVPVHADRETARLAARTMLDRGKAAVAVRFHDVRPIPLVALTIGGRRTAIPRTRVFGDRPLGRVDPIAEAVDLLDQIPADRRGVVARAVLRLWRNDRAVEAARQAMREMAATLVDEARVNWKRMRRVRSRYQTALKRLGAARQRYAAVADDLLGQLYAGQRDFGVRWLVAGRPQRPAKVSDGGEQTVDGGHRSAIRGAR